MGDRELGKAWQGAGFQGKGGELTARRRRRVPACGTRGRVSAGEKAEGRGTHGIAFDGGVAHAAAEEVVDAEDEGLEEEAAIEGLYVEVDVPGGIVDGGLAGHGEACGGREWERRHVRGEEGDTPTGISLKRTRAFVRGGMARGTSVERAGGSSANADAGTNDGSVSDSAKGGLSLSSRRLDT